MQCLINKQCGGCDLLEFTYEQQLKQKREYVERKLKIKVESIIPAVNPYHYRHKVVASATTINNKLRLGLYINNSKEIIPTLNCLIQDKDINELLAKIEAILNKYKIPAYQIDRETGIIKHVLVRKSFKNGDMLIVIVTNGELLPNQKAIIQEITNANQNVKTIIKNIHHKKTSLVLLDKEQILYGNGYIQDEIEGLKFNLSAKSFYQVNPPQAIKLYLKAIEVAKITKNDLVIDCYSGIGTISLLLAKKAKEVIAIEVNKSAHLDALKNKKQNNIGNVTFINDDVLKALSKYHNKVNCLFLDPTRDGASSDFLKRILEIRPTKIVYISCNVDTQVRDLEILSKYYCIKNSFACDMFCQTNHIETVVLLELKKS